MNKNQRQADSQTCEIIGSAIGLSCCTKHDEYEYTGEDDLCKQTTQYRDICLKVISTSTLKTWHILSEHIKQQSEKYEVTE